MTVDIDEDPLKFQVGRDAAISEFVSGGKARTPQGKKRTQAQ